MAIKFSHYSRDCFAEVIINFHRVSVMVRITRKILAVSELLGKLGKGKSTAAEDHKPFLDLILQHLLRHSSLLKQDKIAIPLESMADFPLALVEI